MATVNAAINPHQLQQTLQTFERETTKMDMAGELSELTYHLADTLSYNAKWKMYA